MSLTDTEALVRVHSHRARNSLARLLGKMPRGFYRWVKPGCEWRAVPKDRLADALKIKGLSRSRWVDDMRQYIDW